MVAATGGTLTIGEIPFTPRAKRVLELSVEEARLLGPQLRRHRAPAPRPDPRGRGRGRPRAAGAGRGPQEGARGDPASSWAASRRPAPERRRGEERDAGPGPVRPRSDAARRARASSTRSSGASSEIERVIQVLCRRKKNNPVLIGEPGVGKTAIVEGLAQRIVENKVPEILKDKRIVHARSRRGGGRHQVPRPVRGAAQGRHERDPRVAATSSSSSTSCTPSSARAAPRAPSTPPTCSSRRWPAASCSASAPPPWTSTASTSRRTARWSGASRRSWSIRRPRRRRSRSSGACATSTRRTTGSSSPTRRSSRPSSSSERYITDRFLPDKAIDVIDEAGARARLAVSAIPKELGEMEQRGRAARARRRRAAIQAQEFEKAARLRDQREGAQRAARELAHRGGARTSARSARWWTGRTSPA